MDDLISRSELYEKTAEWEAQALHMVEITMHDEDPTEWRKWTTILNERSAFKHDVADAPSTQSEIIRCGKCTHKDKDIDYCHYLGITICESDYCSYAERRHRCMTNQ